MEEMKDRVTVRRMTHEDVEAAYRSDSVALTEGTEEQGLLSERPPEEVRRRQARYHHLIDTDPAGCWVGVANGKAVGSALALRREGVWGLSLFAVDACFRKRGLGRELLGRALAYADGCRGGIICSSTHPAAMRRYALAGFELLPTLSAEGTVRREALPAMLKVREGGEEDFELAAEVDRLVRGASHGPDLGFLLRAGGRLLVCERRVGRGYAVEREGSPWLLAATRPEAAAELLWACLSGVPDDERAKAKVRWITSAQSAWAVPVVLKAGLSLSPSGPLCVKGELGTLAPYLPSGIFL
jgi:ribosomal protein S18 acetylase RimI-like enzyme